MEYYKLDFISQNDFEQHVLNTIKEYEKNFQNINLKNLNKNIIDPIKLLFDKNVSNLSYEDIIKFEINRQIDKSNNNSIGYFHQNIFKFIKNCTVPKKGWDIIYNGEKKYYVEMKNKHNTMNSSSSQKTYMKFLNHLVNSDEKDSVCVLVEIIAKSSQNIPWIITLDGEKQLPNERIRRISIDKFYEIVTGDKNAFYKICYQLPKTIEKLVNSEKNVVNKDHVNDILNELKKIDSDLLIAFYKLAFSEYEGFNLL